jgi:MATE family multidrug resistance protein
MTAVTRVPVSAHRDAWRLAWPLILSNMTVPLLGMVDTAVVGHLPAPHHLGAVALGSATFSALYFTVVSLRMGTTGLIAQAYGAGDREEIQAGLARALILGLICALAFILRTTPITAVASRIFSPTSGVEAGLATYLPNRLLAAPAALANTVLLGWLLGVQDARSPLLLLLVGNGVNMALDLLFVFGFGWEVAGVALATVIAEYGTLLLGGWLVWRKLGRWSPTLDFRSIIAFRAMRRLIGVNLDIVLRSLCLQIGFVGAAALGSRQGEVILAANTVLLQFIHLGAFALDGFAFAASTLVGRHAGAGDRAGMRQAVRAGMHWSLAFALMITAAFWLAGDGLIRLLTDIADVRAAAGTYLLYVVLMPLIAVAAFLFDGVFIGATRTREMRNAMVLAVAIFGLFAWLLMPPFGNHGLWLAMTAFMASRGVLLGAIYWWLERGRGFILPRNRNAEAG